MTEMKRGLTGSIAAVMALGLAGCINTPSAMLPDPDPLPDPDSGPGRVFAVDAGTASKALADGRTLEAPTTRTSGTINRYHGNRGTAAADATFAIRRNDAGGADATVNGQTHSFAATDLQNEHGWSKDQNGYKGAFTWGPSIAETFGDNSDHAQLWQYFYYDNDTGRETAGLAVVGTETRAAALAGKASASYRGYATVRVRDANEPENETQLRSNNAMLTADFGARTVSGQITNFEAQHRAREDVLPDNAGWSEYAPAAGALVLEQASISGSGYQGQVSGSVAGIEARAGSTFSGGFFGPTGGEMAGVIKLSVDDRVGVGGYRAWEQPGQ